MIPRYHLHYPLDLLIDTLVLQKESTETSHCENSRINVFTSDGSGALRILLRSLNLEKGTKVVVPLLTCERVAQSVVEEGLTPVFADISVERLMCTAQDYLDACKCYEAKVIIAVSMWGYPVEIKEIEEKKPTNVHVIQDCCLSFGSFVADVPDGMLADAAFFSFGSGKPLCLGIGGAISIKDSSRILLNSEKYQIISPFQHLIRSSKVFIKSILFTRFFYSIAFKSRKLSNSSAKPASIDEPLLLPLDFGRVILKNLFRIENSLFQAKENYFNISRLLLEKGCHFIMPTDNTHWNYWMFPILLPEGTMSDVIIKKGESAGFEIISPYKATLKIAADNWGYQGDCPKTESILHRLILIPSLHALRPTEIQNLVMLLD